MATLTAFEVWAVKQNLRHIEEDGEDQVLATLRRNGYHKIAQAVEEVLRHPTAPQTVFDELPDAWERDGAGRRLGALSTEELFKIIEEYENGPIVYHGHEDLGAAEN